MYKDFSCFSIEHKMILVFCSYLSIFNKFSKCGEFMFPQNNSIETSFSGVLFLIKINVNFKVNETFLRITSGAAMLFTSEAWLLHSEQR